MRSTLAALIFLTLTVPAWSQWSGGPTGPISYSGGNVGIGTASPSYSLDVANSTTTGLRVGSYGTLTSIFPMHVALQGGADYKGTSWIARATSSSGVHGYNGNLYFMSDTALTVGAPYTMTPAMFVQSGTRNVGIGTTSPGSFRLAVEGTIGARDVIVTNVNPWPDYIFRPGYRLTPLSEVRQFIQANGHLPDIPTEAEAKEKGVSLGDMQAKLLAKVEELTLHLIRQEQENRELRVRVGQLETRAAR